MFSFSKNTKGEPNDIFDESILTIELILFANFFSLLLNNTKISTLDAIKVIKKSLKSVQFSGYFFVNL